MIRAAAVVVCVLALGLAAGCGEDTPTKPAAPVETSVDFGANPARLTLEGVGASVKPPAGTWLGLTDRPGPDRWTEQWRREADGVVLQAATFPMRAGEHPTTALVAVVDAFVRSRGTDGFGQTDRGAGLVRGASAAWTGFAAVIDGTRHEGKARLVQVGADRWALAIGLAPDAASKEAKTLADAYVDSLLPDAATFYARRFVDPATLTKAVTRGAKGGEEVVTVRDVAAVQLVLEMASGGRFPLDVRPTLHRALAQEASQGSAASRASFREVARTLDETSDGMDAAQRLAGMRALGKRVLEQLFERAMEGYAPANAYRLAWQGMGRAAIPHEKAPLSVAAMQSLGELATFLASLAADREVPAVESRIKTLRDLRQEGYAALDDDGRAALARAGDDWAALRYAWDHAAPEAKVAFRRAVLAALVAPEQRAEVEALADDLALLDWMQAHGANGDAYARRAVLLPRETRLALVERLGVAVPAHPIGW